MFHLFESVISHVAQLVDKSMFSTLSQCGESFNLPENCLKDAQANRKALNRNTISDTINTIATGSELITAGSADKKGFFAENITQIAKTSSKIEKMLTQITKDLNLVNNSRVLNPRVQQQVKEFIAQLPAGNQTCDPSGADNSFEVRWSLSELEDIVYDFINAQALPEIFQTPISVEEAVKNSADSKTAKLANNKNSNLKKQTDKSNLSGATAGNHAKSQLKKGEVKFGAGVRRARLDVEKEELMQVKRAD